jgi:hypothetical protein
VIVRHDLFEIERIEELPLILADLPHHHPPPPMFASVRRNHCSPAASNNFCNKIGPKPTRKSCRSMSAYRDEADITNSSHHVGL